MKKYVFVCIAVSMGLCQFSNAATLVSTIDGFYGGQFYDTPWLTITNSTSYDFTNVELTLTGYQGLNNGSSQTADLGTITAGTTDTIVWGGVPGVGPVVNPTTVYTNLFEDDYDDEYGGTAYSGVANANCTINDTQYGVPQYYYCADTGNFYATLTATWNNPAYGVSGTPIYSQFSPGEDPLGIGNACGNSSACYVGWEGLTPSGWSESVYDDHSSGGPNGTLANIYVGNPPVIGAVPEPGTLVLLGSGLSTIIGMMRRRRA